MFGFKKKKKESFQFFLVTIDTDGPIYLKVFKNATIVWLKVPSIILQKEKKTTQGFWWSNHQQSNLFTGTLTGAVINVFFFAF